MKTFDRKRHWDKVYEGKSPLDVSWFQAEPVRSLGLIQNSGIGKDGFVIDVGGGASVLVDALLAAGYARVAVLDISAGALEAARGRLGERAGEVEWLEADITAFNPPHSYALWHDRAVFHFLTEKADRENYVQALKKAVPPGGHIVIAAFAVGGPQQCSGLDIVQYDAAKLRRELGEGFELAEEMQELHVTPAGGQQQFSYFRLVRK